MSDLTMKGKQQIEHVSPFDCISRQAAIAVADYTDYPGLAIEDVKKVTDEVVKGLKRLPPEPPEEPSHEAVKEYCRKRGLSIIDTELLEKYFSSAQSEQRWIPFPCPERMPRDGEWCIFTDGVNVSVERYKEDALDHFFPPGRWFGLEDAIAWMPLPKPYRKGGLLQ